MTPKTALITGASSGIGYELAKLFATDKYDLILVSRDQENLQRVQAELQEKHQVKIKILAVDLTLNNAPRETFAFCEKENITLDVLVNDAGFGLVGLFRDLDEQKQLNMIDLNVRALTQLTKLFLAQATQGAKILNVASLAAFQPGPLMAVYYATKAYVLSFSEALAEELKDREISVTALCPGPVATNFWRVAHPNRGEEKIGQIIDEWPANRVALVGYEGMKRGKRIVIPGAMNKIMAFLNRLLPRSLVTRVVMRVNR